MTEQTMDTLMTSVSVICRSKDNPRTSFDQDALQELADSIREHGIIEPIVCRPVDGGIYEIIAGERRWRAAKLAGLTSVPVRVLDVAEDRAAEMRLVENVQRKDLSPIETARGYQALRERGMSVTDIARAVGLSQPAVSNAMRLLDLPDTVLEMVSDGRLTASHGRELLKFSAHPAIVEAVADLASVGKMSVATLAADAAPYTAREPLVKAKLVSGDYNAGHRKECAECPKKVWNLCMDDACAQRLAAEERERFKSRDDEARARQAHLETPEGKAEQRRETLERNKAVKTEQLSRIRYVRDEKATTGWQHRALVAAAARLCAFVSADVLRLMGPLYEAPVDELMSARKISFEDLDGLDDDALTLMLWEALVGDTVGVHSWQDPSHISDTERYLRGGMRALRPAPKSVPNQTETIPDPDQDGADPFHVECPEPDIIEDHETVTPAAAPIIEVGTVLRRKPRAYGETYEAVVTAITDEGTLILNTPQGECEDTIEEIQARFDVVKEVLA